MEFVATAGIYRVNPLNPIQVTIMAMKRCCLNSFCLYISTNHVV